MAAGDLPAPSADGLTRVGIRRNLLRPLCRRRHHEPADTPLWPARRERQSQGTHRWTHAPHFRPLSLPCGPRLANRIAKAATSDALGDGRGNPTAAQIALYRRWAEGGAGLILVGEVQSDPRFAQKRGNLVLPADADLDAFRARAMAGAEGGAQLWLALGHADPMAYPPIGTPKEPSALDLPRLRSLRREVLAGFDTRHDTPPSQAPSPIFGHGSDRRAWRHHPGCPGHAA